jgi:hypothetical protein
MRAEFTPDSDDGSTRRATNEQETGPQGRVDRPPLLQPVLREATQPKAERTIRLADFPQLRLIAWSIPHAEFIGDEDALALYERNWRYVDENALGEEERQLIGRLAEQYGNGILHV